MPPYGRAVADEPSTAGLRSPRARRSRQGPLKGSCRSSRCTGLHLEPRARPAGRSLAADNRICASGSAPATGSSARNRGTRRPSPTTSRCRRVSSRRTGPGSRGALRRPFRRDSRRRRGPRRKCGPPLPQGEKLNTNRSGSSVISMSPSRSGPERWPRKVSAVSTASNSTDSAPGRQVDVETVTVGVEVAHQLVPELRRRSLRRARLAHRST